MGSGNGRIAERKKPGREGTDRGTGLQRPQEGIESAETQEIQKESGRERAWGTLKDSVREQAQENPDGVSRRQSPPGIWRQQVQRQLQQQGKVNKWLASAVVLLGILLAVSLVGWGSLYRKLGQIEKLAEETAGKLQEQEERTAEQEARQEEYYAPAEERTGTTIRTKEEEPDYPEIWGREKVDRPVRRTERQVRERLKELAEEGGLLEEIYENRKDYPDKLLEALANNPEMAGFVAGYPEREKAPKAVLTEKEKESDFPLFLQWDPRWGYEDYGDDGMIGLSGCGPTCVSMALYYLTGDESLTPDVIAAYSMENGYYVPGVGTAWALIEESAERYGVEARQRRIEEESLLETLDQGGVLICSMSSGDFTAAGHFIVIYGYDEEGFLVNDPNCVARSRMHWSWGRLQGQIKNVWEYIRPSSRLS
ncbi:MAG: C39 family peptidase [Roseburia sp.]|nr:C39 family peptidase [Roseburia sp.]MCM1099111.1 C39 family peptidase [Ruminococcus flavefaciens]